MVARLELLVTRLPEDRNPSKIRIALLWTEEDVEQLLALAPAIGLAAAVDAESAGPSLRWLLERIRHVQAFPEGMGYDSDRELPAAAWTQHLTLARTALQSIDHRETQPT